MKKIECPSCAMEVDANNKVCPICGYEFPRDQKLLKFLAVLLIIIFAIFIALNL